MKPEPTTLLQGTLDLLILKSLVAGEMHGLGISRRIQQSRICKKKFLVIAWADDADHLCIPRRA